MGSRQKFWERYIKKQKETPRDKDTWSKEIAEAVVEYGKTPHTDKKLQEYKDKLNGK